MNFKKYELNVQKKHFFYLIVLLKPINRCTNEFVSLKNGNPCFCLNFRSKYLSLLFFSFG